jgi:hypothetical protein
MEWAKDDPPRQIAKAVRPCRDIVLTGAATTSGAGAEARHTDLDDYFLGGCAPTCGHAFIRRTALGLWPPPL